VGESFSADRDGPAVREPKRRDRYIAFEFPDPRRGREVAAAIHAAVGSWPASERPRLVFVEGRRGLVRCGHLQKDEVLRLVNALRVGDPPFEVRSVGTSGTIRAARSRYFSNP